MKVRQAHHAASQVSAPSEEDLLTEVELKIARRADEFARTSSNKSSLNLHCWLMAEAELLGRNVGQCDALGFLNLKTAS